MTLYIPWKIDFCKCRHRYVDGDIYLGRLCLLEWPDLRDIRVRNDEWELGYLPRCLCSPLVMDRLTQYLTKGPGWSLMLNKRLYAGGRPHVCTRGTPLEACPAGGKSLALIGHRASVGGSVSHADWSRVIGADYTSPGGVWIDYIRQALGDSQSIVAVPVNGSLVSPTLFSCRDVICTARSSLYWTVCGTDWVLPAGYQVLLLKFVECWIMDADGFSIVDNRVGVTFGVELYVPWDAPEMVVDIWSADEVGGGGLQ